MSIHDALAALIPDDHPMSDLAGKQVMAAFFMPLDEIGPCTWLVTDDGHAFGIGSRGAEPVYCHVEPHMLGKLFEDVGAYATALAGNAAFSMQNLEMAREHFSELLEASTPHLVDDEDEPIGGLDIDIDEDDLSDLDHTEDEGEE
jgi:hypothetical protein